MRKLGWPSDRATVACACIVLACAASLPNAGQAAAADWGNARILYFEPFTTTIDPRPALSQKRTDQRLLKFDAYGRRLELALEPNAALAEAQAAHPASEVRLYRGQLTGIEGSWARIATRGSNVHGLVWDGTDLYVIEPGEAVRASLVPPLDRPQTTVLFKLSDTILDAGASLCGTTTATQPTALDAYTALTRELASLKSNPLLKHDISEGLRLEISAIGDAAFRAQYASDAEALDQMLLRLNNIDGIFTSELGVRVQAPTTLIYDANSDPLPATTSASALLTSLGTHRAATPQLRSRGLTHLFTGRDLDGATVGIGYIGEVCSQQFGVAITEVRGRGAWLESLVGAHEIGHNFGAIHDGEGECSAVPQNEFLMSPTVHSDKATFSSCSRARIMQHIATASCVTVLSPADLSIPADLGTVHEQVGRLFEWTMPVTNVGGRTSESGRVEVQIPAGFDIIEAWIGGGTCMSGAGVIDCALGEIAGGVTRTLNVTLRAQVAGTSTIAAQLIASPDANLTNNTGSATFEINMQAPVAGSDPVSDASTAPPASGRGGGGAWSEAWTAALSIVLLLAGGSRLRRTRRR